MQKEKPRRGKAPGQGLRKSGPQNIAEDLAQNQVPPPGAQAPAPTVDLVDLRDRLRATRARLLEQVANDWEPGRRYPDTSWCRMLADVQGALRAVDDVAAEGTP